MRPWILGLALAAVASAALAMDEGQFQASLSMGDRKDLTRPQRAQAFDNLVARRDLTSAQKAEAHWRRALFRIGDGADQVNAIADYRQALALNPGDVRIGPALAYIQSTVAETQARLASEPSPQRADDLYQLGRWKDAYAIWKAMIKVGAYPTENAIRHMVEDRILCKYPGRGQIAVPAEQSFGLGDLITCTL